MRDFVGGEFPGDFRNDFIDFGWDTFTEDEKFVKRSIELNNGRAAMMGMLALVSVMLCEMILCKNRLSHSTLLKYHDKMVHEQLDVPILPYQ